MDMHQRHAGVHAIRQEVDRALRRGGDEHVLVSQISGDVEALSQPRRGEAGQTEDVERILLLVYIFLRWFGFRRRRRRHGRKDGQRCTSVEGQCQHENLSRKSEIQHHPRPSSIALLIRPLSSLLLMLLLGVILGMHATVSLLGEFNIFVH